MSKIFYSSVFPMLKASLVIGAILLSGCMPPSATRLDSQIINQHNDARFLPTNDLQCPASLKGKKVSLHADFSACIKPMAMEGIVISGYDGSIQPLSIPYNGNFQEDVIATLKRNITTVCGTQFTDESDAPSINFKFYKLTSQILSIDNRNDLYKSFNIVNLDSQYDYNITTNYVAEVEVGGTLFSAPLVYARGLTKEEVIHQKAQGTNYLVTVSTRTELDHLTNFYTFPDLNLLYSQKNVSIMDMKTVILPVMSNEFMLKYTLYTPDGEVSETKTLSSSAGGFSSNGPAIGDVQATNPSDNALIMLFGNSGIGFWGGSAPVGPYGWLMYDLTQAVISNAN